MATTLSWQVWAKKGLATFALAIADIDGSVNARASSATAALMRSAVALDGGRPDASKLARSRA